MVTVSLVVELDTRYTRVERTRCANHTSLHTRVQLLLLQNLLSITLSASLYFLSILSLYFDMLSIFSIGSLYSLSLGQWAV